MARQFNIIANIQLQAQNTAGVARQIQRSLRGIKVDIDININKSTNAQLDATHKKLISISNALSIVANNANAAANSMSRLASALTSASGLNTLNKSASSLARNIGQTGVQAKNASKEVQNFGEQAGLAARRFAAYTAATLVIIKFTQALKEGFSEAVEFESQMIKIQQVSKASEATLRGLENTITNLSSSLGTSSADLAQVSRILAQAGLSARETSKALGILAQTTLSATFSDINQTGEGLIAVMSQFGLSVEEGGQALDSINAVAGRFAVESDDLISAVRRTGGAFAAAGGSVEDLIALFTSVRSTTRESAETIATGFRTIFTRIQRPKTISFLKELGVELQNTQGQFVGPVEAIGRLNIALTKLESTDPRFSQVVEELGGFRQVSKVIPLIQQFDKTTQALSVAQNASGSVARDSEIAQQALAVQITKTRESFISLIRTMTDSGTFKGTIESLLSLANSFIKVTESFSPLIPLLSSIALFKTSSFALNNVSGFLGGFNKKDGSGGVGTGGVAANSALNSNTNSIQSNTTNLSNLSQSINNLRQAMIGGAGSLSSNGVTKAAKSTAKAAGGALISGQANSTLLTGAFIAQLAATMGGASDETKEFTNSLSQGVLAFVLIHSILNSLSNYYIQRQNATQQQTASIQQSTAANQSAIASVQAVAQANNRMASATMQNANTVAAATIVIIGAFEQLALTARSASQANITQVQTTALSNNRATALSNNRATALSVPQITGVTALGGSVNASGLSVQQQQQQAAIQASIKSSINFSNSINGLNFAVAAASAALITFGINVEQSGRKALEESRSRAEAEAASSEVIRGQGLKSAGFGAGAGAATGGAIGVLFGPPGIAVGVAIGALAGVFGGLAYNAQNASSELRKLRADFRSADFNRVLSSLEDTIKDIDSGFSSFTKDIDLFADQILDLSRRANNETDVRNREEFFQSIRNQTGNLQKFQDKLNEVSIRPFLNTRFFSGDAGNIEIDDKVIEESLKNLENAFDGAGRKIIEAQSIINKNLSVSDVRERFRNRIVETLRFEAATRKAANSLEIFNNAQAFVSDFADSIENANTELSNFQPALNTILAGGRGNAATFGGVSPRNPDLFSKASSGGFVKPSDLKTSINAVLSASGATSSTLDIGRLAQEEAVLSRQLPEILRRAVANSGFDGDRIEEALAAQLNQFNIGPELSGLIVDRLGADISKRGASGIGDLFQEIGNNAKQFAERIFKDADKTILKQLERIAKAIDENESIISNALSERTQLELDIVKSNSDIIRKQFENTQSLNKARGGNNRTSLQDATSALIRRQSAFVGARNALNPKELGDELRRTLREQQGVQNALSTTTDADSRIKLINEFNTLNSKAARFRNALQNLTDSTERTAIIQEQLADAQRDRQIRLDIASGVAFAGPEQQRDFVKNIANVTRASAQGIGAVRPDERQSVLSFLQQAGELRAPVFGQNKDGGFKSGKELQQELVSGFFKQLNEEQGREVFSDEFIKQFTDISTTEEKLLQELSNDFKLQIDASKELGKTLTQQLQSSDDLISRVITDNSNRIRETLLQIQVNTAQSELDSANIKLTGQEQQRVDIAKEVERVFNTSFNEETEKGIKNFLSQFSVEDLEKSVDRNSLISRFENIQFDPKSFVGREGRESKFEGGLISDEINDFVSSGKSIASDFFKNKSFIDFGSSDATQDEQLTSLLSKTISDILTKLNIEATPENRKQIEDNFLSGLRSRQEAGFKDSGFDAIRDKDIVGGLLSNAFSDFVDNLKLEQEKTQDRVNQVLENNQLPIDAFSKFTSSRELFGGLEKISNGLKEFDLSVFNDEVTKASTQIQILETNLQKANAELVSQQAGNQARSSSNDFGILLKRIGIPGFASGGKVPGSGNKDNYLARLTPGEFVVNKNAASQTQDILSAINYGNVQGFADGGGVRQKFNSVAERGLAKKLERFETIANRLRALGEDEKDIDSRRQEIISQHQSRISSSGGKLSQKQINENMEMRRQSIADRRARTRARIMEKPRELKINGPRGGIAPFIAPQENRIGKQLVRNTDFAKPRPETMPYMEDFRNAMSRMVEHKKFAYEKSFDKSNGVLRKKLEEREITNTDRILMALEKGPQFDETLGHLKFLERMESIDTEIFMKKLNRSKGKGFDKSYVSKEERSHNLIKSINSGEQNDNVLGYLKGLKRAEEVVGELFIKNIKSLGPLNKFSQEDIDIDKDLKMLRSIIPGFASGGGVGGFGNGDTVPAMLTPGEFVLNKRAVKALGMSKLNMFNKKFAKGGPVQKFQNGGSVNGVGGGSFIIGLDGNSISALNNFQQSVGNLDKTVSQFSGSVDNLRPSFDLFNKGVDNLVSALNSFNGEITLGGTFDVNVNVNGGISEAGINRIKEGVSEMIDSKIVAAVSGLSENLRDGRNPGTATNPFSSSRRK